MSDENKLVSVGQGTEAELKDDALKLETAVRDLTILNDDDYAAAGEWARQCKIMTNKVNDFIEPLRKSSYDAYQMVLKKKKSMITPLESAEKIIKKKITGKSDYPTEQ